MTEMQESWQRLDAATWPAILATYCQELLAQQARVFLCITGKAGAGKSTLGRQLRKQGLPGIAGRQLAVIDDSVMFAPLLGILPRRVRFRSRERDELVPFLPYLGRKKLVIYVNAHPEVRLSRCDILLRVECAEEIRHERLVNREEGGEKRFLSTRDEADVDLPCRYRLILASGDIAPA